MMRPLLLISKTNPFGVAWKKSTMNNQSLKGQMKTILEWVALKRNTYFYSYDEYRTTVTCSRCGFVSKSLTLINRVWDRECGAIHLRDENAAANGLLKTVRELNLGPIGLKDLPQRCLEDSKDLLKIKPFLHYYGSPLIGVRVGVLNPSYMDPQQTYEPVARSAQNPPL